MNGSIQKRGKQSWRLTIELGKDGNGKRKRMTVTVKGTREDAQRKLEEILTSAEQGIPVESTELTVGKYLDKWLRDYALINTAPRTYMEYKGYIDRYLKPKLGHIPLVKLTAQHIRELYADILEKGLSSTTANHAHIILNVALNHAVQWELVEKNVCANLKPPRRKQKEMIALDEIQAQRFLEASRNSVFGAVYYLALYTGMRRSELLGLQWRDIDFTGKALSVKRTIHAVKGRGLVIGEPKTKSSRRLISLSSGVVAILRGLKAKQKEDRESLGIPWKETDFVFTHADGSHFYPSSVSKEFKEIVRAADLPDIRFHDLRHTHATLMLKNCVHVKVVSERLGHSNISITLDTYSHVLPCMQEEAAQVFEELLVGI